MDKNSYEQSLMMQATIESIRQVYDDKIKNLTEYFTEMITWYRG